MTNREKTTKRMNLALWVTQAMLSAGFLWAGAMKLFQPLEKLAAMWPWTAENAVLVPFTGVLDLMAGLGLILPAMFRIRPQLTVHAAIGSMALMTAAILFHIGRGEASETGVNVVFFTLSAFVAWGRAKAAPIASRRGTP